MKTVWSDYEIALDGQTLKTVTCSHMYMLKAATEESDTE